MGKITFQQSISLDGFSAGPNQSLEEPLGANGEELHAWAFPVDAWREPHGLEGGERSVSSEILEELTSNVGAVIMGRNMFGGGPGAWDGDGWKGWWGDDPPFHTPVFVLTHYARDPLFLAGGNEFHFVTAGPEEALRLARSAAGARNISIGGGAETIQQFLRLGAVDEFWIHHVPIFLGAGTRFLVDIPKASLKQVRAVSAENVTHIKYEVVRA